MILVPAPPQPRQQGAWLRASINPTGSRPGLSALVSGRGRGLMTPPPPPLTDGGEWSAGRHLHPGSHVTVQQEVGDGHVTFQSQKRRNTVPVRPSGRVSGAGSTLCGGTHWFRPVPTGSDA